MTTNPSIQPPIGSTPSNEMLTPQVGTTVLMGESLHVPTPQAHTTLLNTESLQPMASLQSKTSILPSDLLTTQAASQVTILGENTLPNSIPPQAGTSILRDGVLSSLPPAKMPNLVQPMPKKEKK